MAHYLRPFPFKNGYLSHWIQNHDHCHDLLISTSSSVTDQSKALKLDDEFVFMFLQGWSPCQHCLIYVSSSCFLFAILRRFRWISWVRYLLIKFLYGHFPTSFPVFSILFWPKVKVKSREQVCSLEVEVVGYSGSLLYHLLLKKRLNTIFVRETLAVTNKMFRQNHCLHHSSELSGCTTITCLCRGRVTGVNR